MIKTWVASDTDPQVLARALEAHLNEFAGDVLSVRYAVSDRHHVFAVYREIEADAGLDIDEASAIAFASDVIQQPRG